MNKMVSPLEVRNHKDCSSPSQKSSGEKEVVVLQMICIIFYYNIAYSIFLNKQFLLYTGGKKKTKLNTSLKEEKEVQEIAVYGQRKSPELKCLEIQKCLETSAGESKSRSVVSFTGKEKGMAF